MNAHVNMNGEPWVCVKCGETVTPLNHDETWHYIRTGESRCTPCPKGSGMARPHSMPRDEQRRRAAQKREAVSTHSERTA